MHDKVVHAEFWDKVTCTGGGACWTWRGMHDKDGYPLMKVGGKLRRVKRVSYEIHFGSVDDGVPIKQSCGNHGCVHPGHLLAESSE